MSSNEVYLVSSSKKKEIAINGAKALVLGITFKENCGDIRNSKVIDIISKSFRIIVTSKTNLKVCL